MKSVKMLLGVGTALAVATVMLFGCATSGDKQMASEKQMTTEACAPNSLTVMVDPEDTGKVALEEFSSFTKRWEMTDTLHYKVVLRNTSNSPQRFRVNIFLDNGKAVGGLLPRKTGKGLVAPNQTAGFSYPVKGMSKPCGEVMVRIATIEE